jgi:hypothetical protein
MHGKETKAARQIRAALGRSLFWTEELEMIAEREVQEQAKAMNTKLAAEKKAKKPGGTGVTRR